VGVDEALDCLGVNVGDGQLGYAALQQKLAHVPANSTQTHQRCGLALDAADAFLKVGGLQQGQIDTIGGGLSGLASLGVRTAGEVEGIALTAHDIRHLGGEVHVGTGHIAAAVQRKGDKAHDLHVVQIQRIHGHGGLAAAERQMAGNVLEAHAAA